MSSPLLLQLGLLVVVTLKSGAGNLQQLELV